MHIVSESSPSVCLSLFPHGQLAALGSALAHRRQRVATNVFSQRSASHTSPLLRL